MPELPEVETVRRVLKEKLIGLIIEDVEIRYPKMILNDIDYFKKMVINNRIIDISRCAKYLIFNLENGNIISHLRMEGKYFYTNDLSIDNKHVHVIYKLSNGYYLMYQDVRKFGIMEYKTNDDLYNTLPLDKIGVDLVLTKDFDYQAIYDKIKRKKLPIKTSLLDQSIISGLGNIYVDEVLFYAKVDPTRLSNSITLDEIKRIIEGSVEILNLAIANKGTTIKSYTSSLNVTGNYQKFLKVHTKNECIDCKSKLIRVKINGRTTYYCKNCQR